MGSREIGCLGNKHISSLPKRYQGLLSKAEMILSRHKPGKCFVRIVDLQVCQLGFCKDELKRPVSVRSIYEFIFGEWSPENVSVVFTYWFNKYFIPVDLPMECTACRSTL